MAARVEIGYEEARSDGLLPSRALPDLLLADNAAIATRDIMQGEMIYLDGLALHPSSHVCDQTMFSAMFSLLTFSPGHPGGASIFCGPCTRGRRAAFMGNPIWNCTTTNCPRRLSLQHQGAVNVLSCVAEIKTRFNNRAHKDRPYPRATTCFARRELFALIPRPLPR